MKKCIFSSAILFALVFTIHAQNDTCGTFTDERDGTVYKWIQIGNQIWMAENLAYLPRVNQVAEGSEDKAGSYYYVYGYDSTDISAAKATINFKTYGVLYNWTAAMANSESSIDPSGVQGVCPSGWHLPSDDEWTELTDFLGGTSIAGGKLKESGTKHWYNTSIGTTNETGFKALPGGTRINDGTFSSIGNNGIWWTASVSQLTYAWNRYIVCVRSSITRGNYHKESGYSVRCVKD